MARSVYVTRVIPQPGIDLLREHAEVQINESDEPLDDDQLRAAASQHDALVTLLTDRIDRPVLEAGKGALQIVANVAVGFDNIDVSTATELGIMVSNTPGVLTETTADFAWALLMGIARRVCESEALLRSGRFKGWGIMMMLGDDVYAKTLGIIGYGRIGHAVAKRASGFDMRVLYFDPFVPLDDLARQIGAQKVDLDTLLAESDFVSVHVPLTAETHHLISRPQLERMQASSYLINTSRGPMIDEEALAEALRNGSIRGAALDVFENEPAVHPGLLELKNVLLTPHVASASVATRTKMATIAAENVIAAFDGKQPPTLLNPEASRKR